MRAALFTRAGLIYALAGAGLMATVLTVGGVVVEGASPPPTVAVVETGRTEPMP